MRWNFLTKIKKKQSEPELRNAEQLFSTGKIFEAKKAELDAVLKELSTGHVPNEMVRHREVIRAITVLSIKNNRSSAFVQGVNIVLSLLLFLLTVYSINLAYEQTALAEFSTRADRIEQSRHIREGVKLCQSNPTTEFSGLYSIDGKPATCEQVLRWPKAKQYME